MKKICLFGALVLLILVQSPFVFSISCDSVAEEVYGACLEIYNSDLNESDKILLISNLEYQNNFFPDHFLVSVKNNFEITIPPADITAQNKGYISDAWMKIFTLMPSINYSKRLYVPEYTKLLTGFNYALNEPVNYVSRGYPSTLNGDCRTTYQLLKNEGSNKAYVNGQYQGQGKLVPVTIKKDSILETIYTIEVSYKIDHYSWKRYSCGYKNRYWCYSCDYKNNQIKTDKIELKDSINVSYYLNNLFGEISEIISKPQSNRIKLNYSDSFQVSFKDSRYGFYKYLFEIYTSFPPYNVLTIKARDYNSENLDNLFKEKEFLVANSLEDCNINGFDFFNKIENDCSSLNSFIGLRIDTEKFIYQENESFIVNIFPKDVFVNISYANKTYLAKNSLELVVEKPYNKILAKYGSENSEKIIYIKQDKLNSLAYKFLWVILVLILLYSIIKKYWRQTWKNVAS